MPVTGLENFNLTRTSFRRFGARKCTASVCLRTFDVTSAVRKIPIPKRFAYMSSRVDRWIKALYRVHSGVSIEQQHPRLPVRNARRWSELPSTLIVRASARELLSLADAAGVSSIYVTRVAGIRRRRSGKPGLVWYCVRAFVVIRVEGTKSGLQHTEDRFMLVRAKSFEDAERRLRRQWRDYASLYLNPHGRLVSWSLEKVIDVYDTGETEIDSAGTEVYSKLAQRRMRPEYVWNPKQQ
jgi:Domain of unknown function (DUF4288)